MDSSGLSRTQFLRLALLVQGGVVLLSLLAMWLLHIPWQRVIHWDSRAVGYGLAAVVPMLGVYYLNPRLREIALESLGNSLRQLHWYELVGLAALAGFGEELLFRGVLYEALSRWHVGVAVLLSNVAFGALHSLSLNYFVTTTLIGLFMHGLAGATGERNLLAAMVAHGVYDLIAFILLIREGTPTQLGVPDSQ